jgi:hypothetical protein
MPGVGKQGKAVREVTADRFGDHVNERENKDDQERALRSSARVIVVMMSDAARLIVNVIVRVSGVMIVRVSDHCG